MSKEDFTSTTRFSNTAEHYFKHRPSYPSAVINLIKEEGGLKVADVIADVGSGTGIFAQLLLDAQYKVFGIEPNEQMRQKAEEQLSHYANFVSVNASAEVTSLSADSVDCVTAATAFHWFDKEKAKLEFNRILKPGGLCVLVWNVRVLEASRLMEQYENLLTRYGTDYEEVNARKVDEEVIRQFFAPISVKMRSFPHQQRLDKPGFLGRLLSASYAPKPGHPQYPTMMQAAEVLFDKYQKEGYVEFIYDTKCYYGRCAK